MKTTHHMPTLQYTLMIGFLLFGTILFSSCVTKIPFATSTLVPAAEGTVAVKKDNNNNYNISINLIRLADPSRLTPPKNMYIVWMETEGNITKKIGQITTSSSMISQTLKSSLQTVSAVKPTKVFITAEDDANIQYPGGQMVMSTAYFAPAP